ncbi:hypothetical protein HK104_000239 [Borealophlyctis nickersoniae]|nr:hypothetical protein HK104_000239 [Borealophlyctis nickersoniae]
MVLSTMSTGCPSRWYDAKYFEENVPHQFAQDFTKDIHTRIGDIEDALNTRIDDLQREFLEERGSNAEFRLLTNERFAESDRRVQELNAFLEKSRLRATVQCAEDRGGSSSQHQRRGNRERASSQDRATTVGPSDTDSDVEPARPRTISPSIVLAKIVHRDYPQKVRDAGLTRSTVLYYRRTGAREAVNEIINKYCVQTGTREFIDTPANLRNFEREFRRELELVRIKKTREGRGMMYFRRRKGKAKVV